MQEEVITKLNPHGNGDLILNTWDIYEITRSRYLYLRIGVIV